MSLSRSRGLLQLSVFQHKKEEGAKSYYGDKANVKVIANIEV
jgi:hypothetical protein